MVKQTHTAPDLARDIEDFVPILSDKLSWLEALVTAIESAANSDDLLLGKKHIALLAGAARYLSQDAQLEADTFREQACGVQA
jgi:hypothetical protein